MLDLYCDPVTVPIGLRLRWRAYEAQYLHGKDLEAVVDHVPSIDGDDEHALDKQS